MDKSRLSILAACAIFVPMLVSAQERTATTVRESMQDVKAVEVAEETQDSGARAAEDIGPVRWMAPESINKRVATTPENGTLYQNQERMNVRQEFGQTRTDADRTRMKGSEVSAAEDDIDDVIREGVGTRDNGGEGRTDTSEEARARKHGFVPCSVAVASDPASVAAGAASAGAGATPGCGDPQD